MTDTLPASVKDGHYDDAEWRAAAATPLKRRTPVQALTYRTGPRAHPYGVAAVSRTVDGQLLHYLNAEAADADAAKRKPPAAPAAASAAVPAPVAGQGTAPAAA